MRPRTAPPKSTVQLVLASATWTYLCVITVIWLCGGLGSPDPLTAVAAGVFIALIGVLGALSFLATVIGGALLIYEVRDSVAAVLDRRKQNTK
jgi:4-amino-4-deoxy-L-arabinose transferase-like glycosyltransferase